MPRQLQLQRRQKNHQRDFKKKKTAATSRVARHKYSRQLISWVNWALLISKPNGQVALYFFVCLSHR